MSALANVQHNLPDTIEDLSRFVLVGREKVASIRAEIRAIDKIGLAQEVRNQKREEASLLSEALLDAEVRLGELFKQIPKATAGSGSNQYKKAESAEIRSGAEFSVKTKKEVVEKLGFSEDQAHRFETMADNKDIVEQVKAEARENDDMPTRTRVLDLAAEKKKSGKIIDMADFPEVMKQQEQNYYALLDAGHDFYKAFIKVVDLGTNLDMTGENLRGMMECITEDGDPGSTKDAYNDYITDIDVTIRNLNQIKTELLKGAHKTYGKK